MSEEELVSRLRVEAEDQTGEVMKGIAERIEKVKRGIEALGTGVVLGKSYTEYANLARSMEQLGMQVRVGKQEVAALEKQFKEMADETGIDLDKLGRTFYNYVNLSGQSVEEAAKQYKTLGDATKVTGLDIDQFARAAAAAAADMNVKTTKDLQEVISFWATKLPDAMLQPFLQYSGRAMQIMQTMGLTGKRNAEEIALAFGQVTRAVGRPRYAMRELNELLSQAQNASSKLGSIMLPQFSEIQQRGGDLNDMLSAMYKTLDSYHAFDTVNWPWAQKTFGATPEALKALQSIHEHMQEIRSAMNGTADSVKNLDYWVDTMNKDPLSAITHLKGAVDNLELSFGRFIDDVGGTTWLQALARNVDDVSKAVEFLNQEIDHLEGHGKAPSTKISSRDRLNSILEGAGAGIGAGLGFLGTALIPVPGARIAGFMGGGAIGRAATDWAISKFEGNSLDTGQPLTSKVLREYARQHNLAGPEQHATGGIIDRPTLTTVGEEGPEAIIPLSGGTGSGGGGTKANTEAVKENTAVLKRLLIEGRLGRAGYGLKAAYTPGAGEIPTPADAELYGGLTPGGYGGRVVQTVRTDGSGNVIGGVPSASLPSGMATSNIHVPNVIHRGQVPRAVPRLPTIQTPAEHFAHPAERIAGTGKVTEAMNYFMSQGWSHAQASGIVANLQAESGLNQHNVTGDSGLAHGIAQWHASRRAKIERAFGKPVEQMTYQEQLAAVQWELTHSERSAGAHLHHASTASEAGADVSRYYERPLHVEAEARSRAARAAHLDALMEHRAMRREMERPIQLNMRAPTSVGARQRMSSLQSRWFAEDMLGTPRWNSQLDIGFS